MIPPISVCLLISHLPTLTFDLSLFSASAFLDFALQVHSDQFGSDHFAILIDIVKSKKADWPKYKCQCPLGINGHYFTDTTETFPAF